MDQKTKIKFAVIFVCLLGAAGFLLIQGGVNGAGAEKQAYFYDVSAEQLFAAPVKSIEPIEGVDGPERDGVRAVVIADESAPDGKRIAYLQKYTDDARKIREKIVEAEASGGKPPVYNKQFISANTLIRSIDSEKWHAMNSKEAAAIITKFRQAGSDGRAGEVLEP